MFGRIILKRTLKEQDVSVDYSSVAQVRIQWRWLAGVVIIPLQRNTI
jgi:hypothetical protein